MTIGISLGNNQHAIIITDSQSSFVGDFETNSRNKMESFLTTKCAGVIYGSGDGQRICGVFRTLNPKTDQTIESLVRELKEQYTKISDNAEKDYHSSQLRVAKNKSLLIEQEDKRKKFLSAEIGKIMENYSRYTQQHADDTSMMVSGYDETREQIRHYRFSTNDATEIFLTPVISGSGSLGASSYFSTKMNGIDLSQLTPYQLAFFAVNAFTFSTANRGVGGTPKIAHVHKKTVTILPVCAATALANISSHYLAEAIPHENQRATVLETFSTILNSKNPNYREIATRVGITSAELTDICTPYSAVQEKENRRVFGQASSLKE